MKPVVWVGSSLEDVRGFPDQVKGRVGYALYLAQVGDKHPSAKPLQGFRGAGVLEMVADFAGDTYRAIYTVTLPSAVYVLHAFQKKSRRGIATSRQDLEMIRTRLHWAEELERRKGSGHE